ncbi:MAG: NAD(P)/FAD-dependent oxidoreductase, partial [Myxococcales bacterium]|nr:NAD(P)/FAD-dependent oxidoreductase [Myxococcales bacterium]
MSKGTMEHHTVVIVGGGTAGITVAARLRRARPDLDICVVEPSTRHYYQPLWTLVGGGAAQRESTVRDTGSLIPEGVHWVRAYAEGFRPDDNVVDTDIGPIHYDYLVVCPGIRILWDGIEGLSGALGHDGVCSNYSYDYVDSTWEAIRATRSGNAIFTYPNTPVKCGGAPQK